MFIMVWSNIFEKLLKMHCLRRYHGMLFESVVADKQRQGAIKWAKSFVAFKPIN